jgi:hypothetical protein
MTDQVRLGLAPVGFVSRGVVWRWWTNQPLSAQMRPAWAVKPFTTSRSASTEDATTADLASVKPVAESCDGSHDRKVWRPAPASSPRGELKP